MTMASAVLRFRYLQGLRQLHISRTALSRFKKCISATVTSISLVRGVSSNCQSMRYAVQSSRDGFRSFASSTHSAHSASQAQTSAKPTPRELEVVRVLSKIRDPTNADTSGNTSMNNIVYNGYVVSVKEEGGNVFVVMPLDEHYRRLKREVTEALASLSWLKQANVQMEKLDPSNPPPPIPPTSRPSHSPATKSPPSNTSQRSNSAPTTSQKDRALPNVRYIVAVHSCKGGVGKSTVAVNLAHALRNMKMSAAPLRVGLLDTDIYGPSLPTLLGSRLQANVVNEGKNKGYFEPIEINGVRHMSWGFLHSKDGANGAYLRGAMASSAVKQLCTQTLWGDLDVLVIDMPPGTGDIAITITQTLKLTGAVVVSTPSILSTVDVLKGIDLLHKVSVPIVGLVNNMVYSLCSSCSTKHYPFGDPAGQIATIQKHHPELKRIYQLPILPSITEAAETGKPFTMDSGASTVSDDPLKSTALQSYQQLALDVWKFCESSAASENSLLYDPSIHFIQLLRGNLPPLYMHPRTLRLNCRCAACVDEITGKKRIQEGQIPENVRPIGMQPRGNYAVAIHWSDGHASSVYPFEHLTALASTSMHDAQSNHTRS